MNEPIAAEIWGPLMLRVPLGAYFLLAGLVKLDNPNAFIGQIKAFHLLPDPLSVLYGILLPYFEIATGGLLILGAWMTLAGIVAALMLLSFVIALGPYNGQPFNKDILLLGGALSLLYSGAGAWSVDRFRKNG